MTAVASQHAEVVQRSSGLLAKFNVAGVLGFADVHVALRLRRLLGESDESVLLAAALAVRGVRQGSVCLRVAEVAATTAVEGLSSEEAAALPWPGPDAWLQSLAASPLVAVGMAGPADRPLRFVDGRLYLDRYWRQERVVADYVDSAVAAQPMAPDPVRLRAALSRLFPGGPPDRRRLAAAVASYRRFSIVAGGPGTGKTSTVARLLAILQDLEGGRLRVGLAAPTGKAAARMTEAAADAMEHFSAEDRQRIGTLSAMTLHRLLGSRRNERTRFWHNRDNRLPFDVVVVDEASMVSLTMMSRLVEALRADCRLILVGDPDQLSSVEVGAVLGDLVHRAPPAGVVPLEAAQWLLPEDVATLSDEERHRALTSGVVQLTENHRASPQLQELAEAIRTGSVQALDAVLARGYDGIELVETDPSAVDAATGGLRTDVVAAGEALVSAARAGRGADALTALERHRLVCGHREGPYGVARWGSQVQDWLTEAIDGYASDGLWYVGRPLLVTANDYQLQLFNGDTGVVVNHHGRARAAFRRDGNLELLAPSRLAEVQTVHAMSVHRSQGSQFDRVTVVLPPEGSPLLTQELVYTAVTRAKSHIRLIGTRAALEAAIQRPIQRASGLRGDAG
jgi:exodeoxyribonuclease V alpha subunit